MKYVHAKGARIPCLGLGTWELRGTEAQRITEAALDLGYTHVDTAQMYGNEEEIGKAIARSGIDRDKLFVTTKVWWENLSPAAFARSVEGSLSKLGLQHVDLLLIHWPHPDLELAVYLDELMEMEQQGLTRFIGISNFTPELIEQAVNLCPDLINNQVEYHPFLDQSAVLRTCRRHGLSLTAYSPIARGKVLQNDTIRQCAENHGKTPVQVTLRWHVQQADVIAIPKTSHAGRLAENLDIFDFELTGEEMEAISRLGTAETRLVDPEFAPDW